MAKINKVVEPVEEQVVEPEKKPRAPKKTVKKGKVAHCELLNVRAEANTACEVVKCLNAGTEFEILGEEGEFYKIADGFVMKSFVEV